MMISPYGEPGSFISMEAVGLLLYVVAIKLLHVQESHR